MVPVVGLGLHLRLRHARRAGRLDHRLGPDHRVRGRQRRGGDLLVGLLPGAAARLRHRLAGLAGHRLPHGGAGGARRSPQAGAGGGRRRSPPSVVARRAGARRRRRIFGIPLVFNLPAFLIVMLITWVLVRGIRESAWFNSAMVVLKLAIIALLPRASAPSTSSRRTGPVRAQRLGGRISAPRRSSSSPTSASTRSRRRRRRRRIRSATCRSASSPAWSSARSSTSSSRSCSPACCPGRSSAPPSRWRPPSRRWA